MNISWQYLDKRNATISALKDYGSMKAILANANEKIVQAHDHCVGVSSPSPSGIPKSSYLPSTGEGRMIQCFGQIDVLQERYRQATEFMEWLQPAWDVLTDDEQTVLKLFYIENDTKQIDAMLEICDRFCIERSSAYKKKDRALTHLSTLLYGK
jgi:hypothetical protein